MALSVRGAAVDIRADLAGKGVNVPLEGVTKSKWSTLDFTNENRRRPIFQRFIPLGPKWTVLAATAATSWSKEPTPTEPGFVTKRPHRQAGQSTRSGASYLKIVRSTPRDFSQTLGRARSKNVLAEATVAQDECSEEASPAASHGAREGS